MHSFKDKVSRFFSDSPMTASPAGDERKETSYSSAGGKYLSSFLSYMNPAAHADEYKSDTHPHRSSPDELVAVRWKSFEWQDKHFNFGGSSPELENKKSIGNDNDEDHSSGRSTSDSDVFEDAPDPSSPSKTMSNLTENSYFITPDLYEFFESSLPNIVKGCQWALLYSTAKHGISLRTLIRKSGQLSGPCLLIVGDTQGAVFGGLLECPLKPTAKRKYQGTNETFVFTSIYGEPRLFRPTGSNRYFYLCLNDLLAVGGGGNFALCLDGDLLSGTSGPCETFGSPCLAYKPEFNLKNVELWGFTHASQYLSWQ
uniref:TLDc domain-containing protein n=2 Tax=Kalanchoe fedtschenkoi TaxID=63787 RepID=A0A7N0USD9_KALFE